MVAQPEARMHMKKITIEYILTTVDLFTTLISSFYKGNAINSIEFCISTACLADSKDEIRNFQKAKLSRVPGRTIAGEYSIK
jgi:hypothetical protein